MNGIDHEETATKTEIKCSKFRLALLEQGLIQLDCLMERLGNIPIENKLTFKAWKEVEVKSAVLWLIPMASGK